MIRAFVVSLLLGLGSCQVIAANGDTERHWSDNIFFPPQSTAASRLWDRVPYDATSGIPGARPNPWAIPGIRGSYRQPQTPESLGYPDKGYDPYDPAGGSFRGRYPGPSPVYAPQYPRGREHDAPPAPYFTPETDYRLQYPVQSYPREGLHSPRSSSRIGPPAPRLGYPPVADDYRHRSSREANYPGYEDGSLYDGYYYPGYGAHTFPQGWWLGHDWIEPGLGAFPFLEVWPLLFTDLPYAPLW